MGGSRMSLSRQSLHFIAQFTDICTEIKWMKSLGWMGVQMHNGTFIAVLPIGCQRGV
jgi:hypothetical protein